MEKIVYVMETTSGTFIANNMNHHNCNRVLGGNYERYTRNLIREKGQNEPDRLWEQARENKKLSNVELEEMLNEWKSILKTIKKDQVE